MESGRNYEEDAKSLRNAKKGGRIDEDAIIQIIGNTTTRERHGITKIYKSTYGTDLIEDLANEHRVDFKKVVISMFYTPVEVDVSDIFQSVNIAKTDEDAFTKKEDNPFEIYEKEKVLLDEGPLGRVYLVQHKISGKSIALKEIPKSEDDSVNKKTENKIMNEINILRKLDHPNIVKIYEFFDRPLAYYITRDYFRGGELFNEINYNGPFDEQFTAFIMYQLFSVVFYYHSMGIINMDLKPENIHIERNEKNGYLRIKLVDFSIAKIHEKGNVETELAASSYYIAPEVLNKSYNEKCDLWSCGVIMYILLTSRPPFEGIDDNEIIKSIEKGYYDMTSKMWNKKSENVKNLIKSLLVQDPTERLSAEEALNHQWFKQNKTKEKLNELIE